MKEYKTAFDSMKNMPYKAKSWKECNLTSIMNIGYTNRRSTVNKNNKHEMIFYW